ENIAYFGRLHGLDAATIDARIEEMARTLGVEDFLDRRTEGFSQGQRTKTAIARALVHAPRNVILDEPTNGLDVMTTRGLRAFLQDLRAKGHCVIFSSHIMQEVAALRSEEHTSELQSRENLVCRLLLEKKKNKKQRCKEAAGKR